MKIIHLSDLHLGKRLENYNLKDDQEHILIEILKIINDEKPDAMSMTSQFQRLMPSRCLTGFLSNLRHKICRYM